MAPSQRTMRSGRVSRSVLPSHAGISTTAVAAATVEPAPVDGAGASDSPPPPTKESPRKRRRVTDADDHVDATSAGPAKAVALKVKTEATVSSTKQGKGKAAVNKENPSATVSIPDDKPRRASAKKSAAAASTPEVFPPRIQGSTHYVGAHISSAGGVENAPVNALRIGGNAFSLFVRPKMQWASKPFSETNTSRFMARAKEHGYGVDHVVPHGCYLINLANPDKEKRDKSFEAFLDDLQRCEALGVKLYNFHPGSTTGGCDKEQGLEYIAEAINKAHGLTKSVVILIENMAGAGNLVGGTFEELRDIINSVKDKSRVGICLDTCHAFAAGYDLRTQEAYDATMSELSSIVGFEYVKAVHLNDSKTPLKSHKDRHENIGVGHIGLYAFYALMNDKRFAGMPLILETPGGEDAVMHEVWKREVAALYSLQNLPPTPCSWSVANTLLSEVQQIRLGSKSVEAGKKVTTKTKRGPTKGTVKTEESDSD